ncbi:MAG TPA: glycoside hydrolase family 127 protein, partial [Cyclobacteriaceae bacterium]|nr:glycoside hydrolase family 127 protein [Cyclobacteriaceae bacterium]
MKLYLLTLILLVGAILTGCNQQTQKGDYAAFDKVAALSEVYKPLALTEIKPEGWLKDQISENLDGFTGRLDTLAPGLIMEDKIYGEDRLTKKVKNKDVGALGEEDKQHLKKLQQYVDYILSTQDKDGYLGIYDNDLRYNFDNENGELWAKSSLLRGLLAWYEYTNDQKILAAIEHAVQNVMDNYPVNHSRPFYSRQPNVGGTSHGLTITDVFESLYRITGKEAYRDYCLFLYKDFSEQHLNESAQYN